MIIIFDYLEDSVGASIRDITSLSRREQKVLLCIAVQVAQGRVLLS